MIIPTLPQIPKNKNADLVLFTDTTTWSVELKPSKEKSIGKFRNELKKLKSLRTSLLPVIRNGNINGHDDDIQTTSILVLNDDSLSSKKYNYNYNYNYKLSNNHSANYALISPKPPANPLLDQSVQIIKPARWIDCISRESKRVFVKDNWIVARIRLPSLSKDLVGLKRI
jgi:hypothetical protein